MNLDLIERILGIILPVFAIVGLGYWYARKTAPDMSTVNRMALEVLVPLLIFASLASKSFDVADQWPLLVASAGVVLGSGALAWAYARLRGESVRAFVPPMMFNNCGNMGLPLQVFAFGADGLGPAVALFAMSNTLHFTLGVWVVNHKVRYRALLTSNVMLATYLGVACAVFKPPIPEGALAACKLVGDACIPLMLISLGARLTTLTPGQLKTGLAGAVVCPVSGLISAYAIAPWLPLDSHQYGMLMVFASLPPAVLTYLFADQYNASPSKVAAIVLVGNLAALIFVPIGLAIGL